MTTPLKVVYIKVLLNGSRRTELEAIFQMIGQDRAKQGSRNPLFGCRLCGLHFEQTNYFQHPTSRR